jgi:hypothetical protein
MSLRIGEWPSSMTKSEQLYLRAERARAREQEQARRAELKQARRLAGLLDRLPAAALTDDEILGALAYAAARAQADADWRLAVAKVGNTLALDGRPATETVAVATYGRRNLFPHVALERAGLAPLPELPDVHLGDAPLDVALAVSDTLGLPLQRLADVDGQDGPPESSAS